MKKIEAIIKPFKLDQVKNALHEVGISGMTVTEVGGVVLYQDDPDRDSDPMDFVPKIKIEVVIEDAIADRAVEAMQQAARTDKNGDGKIFIVAIESAVRIRTGENG